jgi:hypothetical protein
MHNQAMHMTGAELALKLGVPLSAPDSISKIMFEAPVYALDTDQLSRLVGIFASGEWIALL